MADLKLPGVGSGFDIQSFVDLTVQAERSAKDQQFTTRASNINVKLSAYGSLTGALDNFKTALAKLGEADAFQKRSTTLSESGFVTATADSNAVAGSYTLQVVQLAQAHKLGSGAVATDKALGSGSLTLGVGDESFTVNIDKTKSSLAEVAAAINNAADNKGVRATVITDDGGSRLVYFADNTGTDNQITVSASSNNDGEDGNSLAALGTTTEIQAAKNAVITIDGATVTRQNNEIKDAIAGVTLNVKKINDAAGDKPTTTLTIGYDKSAVETNLNSFVDAFNQVMTTVNNLTAYDADSESAGPLNGDSSTRNLTSQIRRMLSATVDGAVPPVTSLIDLGITTQQDGTIELDAELLQKQVNENFAKVGILFSGSGADGEGIASKLDALMESFVGTEGILTQKGESLSAQMKTLETEQATFEIYMTSYEERIYTQFSAMDIAVAQMNLQLESVISAFESMSDFNSNS